MEMEEEDEASEQDESTSYLPVTLTITKSTDGSALVVDTIIEDSQFTISDVMYYKDGKLAEDKTTQGAEKRGELYDGPGKPSLLSTVPIGFVLTLYGHSLLVPAFDHLDPTVQEQFQQFIEARGFDESLADAVVELQRGKEVKVRPCCSPLYARDRSPC